MFIDYFYVLFVVVCGVVGCLLRLFMCLDAPRYVFLRKENRNGMVMPQIYSANFPETTFS